MSQAGSVKLYRTFVKGLITEAGYLTYPEDSSTDELNTIPTRKGNRTRRFGIDYESNYLLNPIVGTTLDRFTEFVWRSVNNISDLNFLCQQVGTKIYFFSLEADPISDSLRPFSIDLKAYADPAASVNQINENNVEFGAGKGFLFIAHPYMEPIIVSYDLVTNAITVVKVIVQIRDFEGLNDGLANDQEPLTLSKEHQYNLMNQGWAQPSTQAVPGGIVPTSSPVYYNPYTGSGGRYPRYDGNAIP